MCMRWVVQTECTVNFEVREPARPGRSWSGFLRNDNMSLWDRRMWIREKELSLYYLPQRNENPGNAP